MNRRPRCWVRSDDWERLGSPIEGYVQVGRRTFIERTGGDRSVEALRQRWIARLTKMHSEYHRRRR